MLQSLRLCGPKQKSPVCWIWTLIPSNLAPVQVQSLQVLPRFVVSSLTRACGTAYEPSMRCAGGGIGGWVNGWVNEWMDGWVDEWVNR